MSKLKRVLVRVRTRLHDEDGQGIPEYVAIVAFVALVATTLISGGIPEQIVEAFRSKIQELVGG